jgi:hypothetical protein
MKYEQSEGKLRYVTYEYIREHVYTSQTGWRNRDTTKAGP